MTLLPDGPIPHRFSGEDTITCRRQMRSATATAVPRRPNISSPNLESTAACHDLHVLTSPHSTNVNNTSRLSLSSSPSVVDSLPVRPPPAHLPPQRRDHVPSPSTSSEVTLNQWCAPPPAQRSPKSGRMGFSKEQRIAILLVIDGIFFLVELSVGTFINYRTRVACF